MPKLLGDGKDDIWTVETWDQALYERSDCFAVADDIDGGALEWLREDRSHLYTLFQPGNVPRKSFVSYATQSLLIY